MLDDRAASDRWREIDAIFTGALALSPTARDRYLELECEGRPDMRREVEELLEASTAADGWFDESEAVVLTGLRTALSGSFARDSDRPAPGDRVGRYRIVRRLARGGMGTVYLAERADGSYERRVALKVLRRGLDTDDILERFREERQILARLDHPNIAGLIDGGATDDGRPFLVMELVEGLPITEYSDREALGLDQRLQLFLTACEAVHHAHVHGIVHRDLKPSNILVDEKGRLKLLDFGIARSVAGDGTGTRTRTNRRMMTPDYASPEQVCGDRVGPQSDVYQMGLLLYELLTATRAYRLEGRSPADIERVVCAGRIEPPSSRVSHGLRRQLRGDLDTIVFHALRRDPSHRYATVAELSRDLARYRAAEPIVARRDSAAYRARKFVARNRPAVLAAGTTATVLAVLAAGLLSVSGADRQPVIRPSGGVAVLPFRVSGATPSVAYLREGMLDLLAAKLTGVGGPRALAPATVLSAWSERGGGEETDLTTSETLSLGRDLGASRVLLGEVVGTESSLVLSASLESVSDGRILARASIEGPSDSLLSLVDRLTGQLLIQDADEDHRIANLATVSLPALRAYLEGRAAYRAGRYGDAYGAFRRALDEDPTFALAGLGAHQASAWLPRLRDAEGLQVAWNGRDRLNQRDHAFVESIFGPNYPAPHTAADRLAGKYRVVALAPDDVVMQASLADRIYHWHAVLGLEDGEASAVAHFRRALALDSTFAQPYAHLILLLYRRGDVDEAIELTDAYRRQRPPRARPDHLDWRRAVALGDAEVLAASRSAMDRMSDEDLRIIVNTVLRDGLPMDDAVRAMQSMRDRALPPAAERRLHRDAYILELARGRPAAASRAAARLRASVPRHEADRGLEALRALVMAATYGDGHRGVAVDAARQLEVSARASTDTSHIDTRVMDLCTLTQWRLWNGDTAGAEAAVRRLRAVGHRTTIVDLARTCAILIEAIHATVEGLPSADAYVAKIDSLLATGGHLPGTHLLPPLSLAVARLHEARADGEAALTAVRRRIFDRQSSEFLVASSLRMEGRLAAATGDSVGAIAAYNHYLTLRSNPEPVLIPQADSVRAALAEIERHHVPDGGLTRGPA